MKKNNKDLQPVRNQYEQFPYPTRNPQDEHIRLLQTNLDNLIRINHVCFQNTYNIFTDNIRILVAGGGTGDAVIYLAEQLRKNSNAQITYLDISKASMEVAKQRAKVRNLKNIEWVLGSLLDVKKLNLGKFDYINCSGVLHHLPNPSDGLKALKQCLEPNGVLGIMVYAKYGRTAIYQIQELMRLVNGDTDNVTQKLNNTHKILNSLPLTNWFNRPPQLHTDHIKYGDVGTYDLFLHSYDCAFSVPELFDWLDQNKLKFISFVDESLYDPFAFVQNIELVKVLNQKSKREQYAIAELMSGTICKHTFYCKKE